MQYDLDYYENMLRTYSATAEHICRVRWEFVKPALDDGCKTILDYGSGVGWFRAWRPQGVEVYTYDVAAYPQTGHHPEDIYDLVTLWDVLEHLDDFHLVGALIQDAKYAAVTVPLRPTGTPLASWKHFKPGEHLHYFTMDTLSALFARYGMQVVKHGAPECPPRQDVVSALFRRGEATVQESRTVQREERTPG